MIDRDRSSVEGRDSSDSSMYSKYLSSSSSDAGKKCAQERRRGRRTV